MYSLQKQKLTFAQLHYQHLLFHNLTQLGAAPVQALYRQPWTATFDANNLCVACNQRCTNATHTPRATTGSRCRRDSPLPRDWSDRDPWNNVQIARRRSRRGTEAGVHVPDRLSRLTGRTSPVWLWLCNMHQILVHISKGTSTGLVPRHPQGMYACLAVAKITTQCSRKTSA